MKVIQNQYLSSFLYGGAIVIFCTSFSALGESDTRVKTRQDSCEGAFASVPTKEVIISAIKKSRILKPDEQQKALEHINADTTQDQRATKAELRDILLSLSFLLRKAKKQNKPDRIVQVDMKWTKYFLQKVILTLHHFREGGLINEAMMNFSGSLYDPVEKLRSLINKRPRELEKVFSKSEEVKRILEMSEEDLNLFLHFLVVSRYLKRKPPLSSSADQKIRATLDHVRRALKMVDEAMGHPSRQDRGPLPLNLSMKEEDILDKWEKKIEKIKRRQRSRDMEFIFIQY